MLSFPVLLQEDVSGAEETSSAEYASCLPCAHRACPSTGMLEPTTELCVSCKFNLALY